MPIIHLNTLVFPDHSASVESKIGATHSGQSHAAAESSFPSDTSTGHLVDDNAGTGVQCKEQDLQSSTQHQKVNPIPPECNAKEAKPILVSYKKNVTYPFERVKPGGIDGETTLKDINELIRKKPSASSKAIAHPVKKCVTNPCNSARGLSFSGKAVASRTIIRTNKGRGSVTIIRTKESSIINRRK